MMGNSSIQSPDVFTSGAFFYSSPNNNTMETLQKLIEKRAGEELDKDIRDLRSSFKSRLLDEPGARNQNYVPYNDNYPRLKVKDYRKIVENDDKWEEGTAGQILRNNDSFWRRIRATWLPLYIIEATNKFMQEHDKLIEQVDALKKEIDDLPQQSD